MHDDINLRTESEDNRPRAVYTDMESLPVREIEWLWPGRIPLGKLTLISGDPGLGKSFLTLDLAARVSTGRLPIQKGYFERNTTTNPVTVRHNPGRVVILSAEDDPADTIKPRLVRMNADLRHIGVVSAVRWPSTRRDHAVRLDRDMVAIAGAIKSPPPESIPVDRPAMHLPPCRLVIIDPISAYLGGTDGNSNAEVRQLLSELSKLAEKSGAAVVCVTHLNKDSNNDKKAVYRSMGSLAFTAAARVALMVARHPEDPDRRVVATIKNNLSPERKSAVYTIKDGVVEWSKDEEALTADDLDAPQRSANHAANRETVEWLREALGQGPMATKRLREMAEEDGFSWRSVERAKTELDVVSRREQNAWVWCLP